MKTTFIKTLAILIFLASSVSAGTRNRSSQPPLVRSILASGNVEVYIAQGESESLKIEGSYDPGTSLVEANDGVLKIAYYGREKISVIVTVTNLERIDGELGAILVSVNKLNTANLSVSLKDDATAVIDSDEEFVKTDVDDNATLVLNKQ